MRSEIFLSIYACYCLLVQARYISIVEVFKWGLAAFVLVLVVFLAYKLWNHFSNRSHSGEDEP